MFQEIHVATDRCRSIYPFLRSPRMSHTKYLLYSHGWHSVNHKKMQKPYKRGEFKQEYTVLLKKGWRTVHLKFVMYGWVSVQWDTGYWKFTWSELQSHLLKKWKNIILGTFPMLPSRDVSPDVSSKLGLSSILLSGIHSKRVLTRPDQRSSLKVESVRSNDFHVFVIISCIRIVSTKHQRYPYIFLKWDFPPSTSIAIARFLRILFFQPLLFGDIQRCRDSPRYLTLPTHWISWLRRMTVM